MHPSQNRAVDRSTSGKTRRVAVLSLALSLLIVVLAAVGIYTRTLFRAAAVLYSFSAKTPPPTVRLYERLSLYHERIEDLDVRGPTGVPLSLRVYTPQGRRNAPTIVCVHGTVPEGKRAADLNRLAHALVSQGFRVVLPSLPEEQKLQIASGDLEVIADTITWASATNAGRPVSVFGVSFGGGLAIVASELPRAKPHVRLVLVISAYNDLTSIAKYYVHEPVSEPDGTPYPDVGPRGGAILFLQQYLAEMVPAADVDAMRLALGRVIAESMEPGGRFPVAADDPTLDGLTPAQRELFVHLELVNTPEIRQRYLALIARHRGDFLAVSPASVLGGLDLPLYGLHGTMDRDVPVGELLWMQREVPRDSDSHFLTTPWMQHASVINAVPTMERLRVGWFLAQILERAEGH